MSKFTWGTVTGIGPLRVRLDGDAAAVPFTPDSLIDPANLIVTDRVRCEISHKRLIVLGRSGGLDLTATLATALAAHSATRPRRNRIINGNFRTNQRAYASTTSVAAFVYMLDRWKSMTSTTSLTFTAAPQGQEVTISSGDQIAQNIERANMEAGTYVLSWEGTALGRVHQAGFPTSFAASPIVLNNTGTTDVVVEFQANGGARTVGKVQVELGSTPTPFEVIPIGEELLLCQRYYFRASAAASSSTQPLTLAGFQTALTVGKANVRFPTTMRVPPTLTTSGGSTIQWTDDVALGTTAVPTIALANTDHAQLQATISSGGAVYRPGYFRSSAAAGWLGFDAEM